MRVMISVRIVIFIALMFTTPLLANELAYYPALKNNNIITLNIVGTTDRPLFVPFIQAFQKLNPTIAINYQELESGKIYQGVVNNTFEPTADLIISSAVDLQLKLANDGYAMAYDSPYLYSLPHWAHWRNEVFGFTFEPAVIVYNKQFLNESSVPHTHLQLAKLLENNEHRYKNKIGTYDIAHSGVGYLMATHDEFISSNFWRLTNAFANSRVKLSTSTPQLLNWLESGDIIIAYNLLGSYAFARSIDNQNLGIIVPDDYSLVLTRSVLIPRTSLQPAIAKQFIDFLLSTHGQTIASSHTGFGSLVADTKGRFSSDEIMKMSRGTFQPVAMTPTLLVAYDRQKREQFLRVWQDIIAKGDNKVPLNEKSTP